MKFIRYLLIAMLLSVLPLSAVNQDTSKIAIAAEDIMYLSQKIANDYLRLYHSPHNESYKTSLKKAVKKLENDIRLIAINTKNDDIKNILDFLSYSKDQIKSVLKEQVSRKNAALLLDDSNSLAEGITSIFSDPHDTSMQGKIRFHIMKISKLYMAIHLKFDPTENTELFYKEMQITEALVRKRGGDLKLSWNAYKNILDPSPIYFLPNITSLVVADLENIAEKI